MQFRHLTKTVLTLAAAGCCCAASAHPLFVHTTDTMGSTTAQRYVAPEDLLFALPQSENQPKLWRDMSAKERADIWPFLPNGMKKRYWRSMTNSDRRAMRAELSPRDNAEFRSRFVSPDNCRYRGQGGPEPKPEPVLSQEERDLMRQQIREMHVQIYHYHHGAPSVVVTPLPADGAPDIDNTPNR